MCNKEKQYWKDEIEKFLLNYAAINSYKKCFFLLRQYYEIQFFYHYNSKDERQNFVLITPSYTISMNFV